VPVDFFSIACIQNCLFARPVIQGCIFGMAQLTRPKLGQLIHMNFEKCAYIDGFVKLSHIWFFGTTQKKLHVPGYMYGGLISSQPVYSKKKLAYKVTV